VKKLNICSPAENIKEPLDLSGEYGYGHALNNWGQIFGIFAPFCTLYFSKEIWHPELDVATTGVANVIDCFSLATDLSHFH